MHNPFRYFNSSPEVIRSAVMPYVRFPLSLRQVEDLLNQRGIDVSYETVRYWWNRFGPLFAAEIRKRRIRHGSYSLRRWHLDEVFVRINGETHWRMMAGKPPKLVAVALANKMARIVWALSVRKETYRAPAATAAAAE